MDHFPFIEACLKKFNYPNIRSMDQEQIAEIFSTINRHFLVSWLFKMIDPDYDQIVENMLKEDLGDLLYHNGFCTDSQKIQFMNGALDSETQFKIMYRMFHYMDSLSGKENRDEMKPFSLEKLHELLEFDTNLFPAYGRKKTLSSTQREQKIKEYAKEIQYLKEQIELKTSKESKNTPLIDSDDLKGELSCNMKSLEENISCFKSNALNLIENKNTVTDEKIKFKKDFDHILKVGNEEAAAVSDFIGNMNTVLNFKDNNVGKMDLNGGNNCRAILRDIAGLCDDVITASK